MKPRPDLSNERASASLQREDIELVSRMARGDGAALGRLFDRHAAAMLSVAQRICGRGNEAEDLVHEVFLEAWRRAANYDPERGSVRSWLLLRTRSRALDHRKSARVSRRVEPSEAWMSRLVDPRDGEHSPDGTKAREALLALPPEQRSVILLAYFEGLSSSEIAEQLEIPIGTVKSRTAAALGALRAALGEIMR